jgi:hypothetical protein
MEGRELSYIGKIALLASALDASLAICGQAGLP